MSSSVNHLNGTNQTRGDTPCQIQPPVILGSNDHVPRFLYKEFPVVYLSVGAIINCVLFYYIIVSKRYRSPLFTFIASLTIADAIACLGFTIRAYFIYPVVAMFNPALMCKVLLFIGNVSATSSAYHLICFAILRYYQLCYPLHARIRVTCGLMVRCCSGIWCLMLLYFIPIAAYQDAMPVLYEGEVTHVCIFTGRDWLLNLCFLIINTSIPCVVIMFVHILKYIQMKCKASDLRTHHERQSTDARAITIVIVLFFLSWLPANIYAIVTTYTPGYGIKQDKIYLNLEYAISYNSALDPIVYCIAAKTVRDDIKKFLDCTK